MVYSIGIKPRWRTQVEAEESLVVSKGEFILVKNHIFNSEEFFNPEELPSEHDVALDYIRQIEEQGGKVRYLKLQSEITSIQQGGWFRKYTIEECVIEGNAIPVAVIYGIIILIGIVLVYYRPLIYKLGGVTTIESIVSDLGIALPVIAVILVLLFVIPYLTKS